jgi:hypothetical protein
MHSYSRRSFLSAAATSSALGAGCLEWFPSLRADDTKVTSQDVQFRPEIEPLVRLMEDTPRETLIDRVMTEIRSGTSYQSLLGALFLAGIRNVQPRPAVGFKFHSVLVVHSAHQASIAASDRSRWMPLLWAIDYFKSAQATDIKEGDWTMQAVNMSKLPSPERALESLDNALKTWDEEAADAAAAAATQMASQGQLLDMYARYAARDFRSIGHKCIYVSGAFRTLSVIGWEHAEPVMRSLAYAILNHTGESNPAQGDFQADRAGRANWRVADTISSSWFAGKLDHEATLRVVEGLRQADPIEAAVLVAELINKSVHPRSIYDGILLAASELVARQPAIVPLHAVTTSNSLHYLFYHVSDERLRKWLLLQNASFLAHFREAASVREKLLATQLESLAADAEATSVPVDKVFELVRKDRNAASKAVFQFLQSGGKPELLMNKARELVFLKGTDSHDYKFSSAAIEDAMSISPRWRSHYLAGCSHLLHGASEKTTPLAQKVLAMTST